MADHETNMKDPVWLAEQLKRVKEENALLLDQRDVGREKNRVLDDRVKAAEADVRLLNQRLDDVFKAHNVDLEKLKETQQRLSDTETDLANAGKLIAALRATDAKRRAALGKVMAAVGKVVEEINPLLSE